MSQLYSDSIFWIEVGKIKPNPYQPRKEFNQDALNALAESIRQYGVLQPLVVTRQEQPKPDGGIAVEYELIAGERRLRASKIAGVAQVPVVIRTGEDNSLMKLELAIIENLQREDLNPVDRAKAFQRFVDEFNYKHIEIAKKIGKSREYVSNSLRLLTLPEEILEALTQGKITEGHARPLMMLNDRPEEQMTLFKEALFKKLTVRDVVGIARRIAKDKVRKKDRQFDPEILKIERDLTEQLGTRVHIEQREVGGKITIDFFSDDDLKNLLGFMQEVQNPNEKSSSGLAGVIGAVLNEEKKPEEDDTLEDEKEEKEEVLKDEEIEAPIEVEEKTGLEGLSEEATEESSLKKNNLEEIDNELKAKELSEQETQILDLANQIGKDGEVESGLIKQKDELEENGKNSEEIEKKINDFDANLMGETKDDVSKEESPVEIPVSEKIVELPLVSEGDQYKTGERPTLKNFLEEQYKKKFMFLEKKDIPQAPEKSSEDQSYPELSEVSDSSVVLEQQEGEISKEGNIPQAPTLSELSPAPNSDVVLEQQEEERIEEESVSENNEVLKEEVVQNLSSAPTQAPTVPPKNDDDELYSIKNFSL